MPVTASVLLAGGSALYQGVMGISQKAKADKLKELNYMPPELLANKELARQQAYGRQAPGQALANENVQRAQANTIAAGQKMYGGDTNKQAAVVAGAQGKSLDAFGQNAARGAQFSEGAFGRLSNANSAIAAQKRQNHADYVDAKSKLLYASDQNIYNSINNIGNLGQAYFGEKGATTGDVTANAGAGVGNRAIGGARFGRGAYQYPDPQQQQQIEQGWGPYGYNKISNGYY